MGAYLIVHDTHGLTIHGQTAVQPFKMFVTNEIKGN